MTLATIFAAVVKVLGLSERAVTLLNNVLNALTGVTNLLGEPAQQHSVEDVLLDTDTIITELNDPVIGLAAILAEIDAQAVGILSAINGLPQVGDPVVLPTVPPSGYGSPDVADIVDQVWNDPQPNLPTTPGDALLQVARSLNTTGVFDMPLYAGNFRVALINWPTNGFVITSVSYPVFDPTDILVSEDLLACITRQNPTWNCGTPWADQSFVGLTPTDGSMVTWTTIIDEPAFQIIKAGIFPIAPNGLAPKWPGLAGVTLGAPVAITSQMTITEPMDGVLVTITAVGANKVILPYDTQTAYKFIGALAFVSDNGDAEPFQQLAFTNALYCPLDMTLAAGVVLRVDVSVVGTVTPWIIG